MQKLINNQIKKVVFTSLLLSLLAYSAFAQDTLRWVSMLDDVLLYESIELYPNATFKWTSEYDLSFSETGTYEQKGKLLTLTFSHSKTKISVKKFLIEGEEMYLLNEKGKKVRLIKDSSVKTPWSWLRFGRHRYCFYLSPE